MLKLIKWLPIWLFDRNYSSQSYMNRIEDLIFGIISICYRNRYTYETGDEVVLIGREYDYENHYLDGTSSAHQLTQYNVYTIIDDHSLIRAFSADYIFILDNNNRRVYIPKNRFVPTYRYRELLIDEI